MTTKRPCQHHPTGDKYSVYSCAVVAKHTIMYTTCFTGIYEYTRRYCDHHVRAHWQELCLDETVTSLRIDQIDYD